jgi:hypothetical protein
VPSSASFEPLSATCRLAVATLREARIPFALGGSLSAWARGGPEPQNDLDLMVKPADAEQALRALVGVGMRPEHPPEEWLLKAWNGDVMVDLIFRPAGMEMTDEVLARAEVIPVLAVATPVLALEDMLATKLLALGEHNLDLRSLLGIVRALREQIDWPLLRERTHGSAYASAFFTLVEELGICAPVRPGERSARRVRVVQGES